MRPRKKILCVDADENALSRLKFIVETWNYRVFTSSPESALTWIREASPNYFDLVIANVEKGDTGAGQFVAAVRKAAPQTRMLMFSRSISAYPADMRADIFLPKGSCSAFEMRDRIQTLMVRKRGPKKKPVESVVHETLSIAASAK